ncbi:alpha/beta hydrolase fold domain-containing protein [Nibribacter ruber]|uniref:Alpha/beta hydrolase fold domain-containing protein n=2 Tax=Nibribacter ruber TaxID=2698458 RepID=A0A6P1P4Z2_9BACT|nr:alpha/beta hydrolase fold domain-containing protein [Nibribacter ruber]
MVALAAGALLLTSCEPKRTVDNEAEARDEAKKVAGMDDELFPSGNPDTVNTTTTDTSMVRLKPTGAKPAWGSTITPPMQTVIEKLASYKAKPIPQLTAPQARTNPTPTTAVMDLMKENNIPMPPSKVDTLGKMIPVQGGQIHARVYTPKTGRASYPVIVYYHGGGWVIADLDTYDGSARGLAEQADAIVISVAYRQAPEHKYPTAHNDAFAAYKWALTNVASMKGDAKNVAVVGESAGGNLAAAVSMMARDQKVQMPVHQVLVYPIAGYNTNTASYQKYAQAKPLDKPMMEWFFKQYLNSPADGKKPWIDLVNANLKGLPPTTIVGAEIDPLASEGQALAEKLKAAGVETDYQKYNGVTHEFFGMATVLPEAKSAQAQAAMALKQAFDN